jgi:hypothetical protein
MAGPAARAPNEQVSKNVALEDETPYLHEATYALRFEVPMHADLLGEVKTCAPPFKILQPGDPAFRTEDRVQAGRSTGGCSVPGAK